MYQTASYSVRSFSNSLILSRYNERDYLVGVFRVVGPGILLRLLWRAEAGRRVDLADQTSLFCLTVGSRSSSRSRGHGAKRRAVSRKFEWKLRLLA